MITSLIDTSAANTQAFSPRTSVAARLGAAQRADLAIHALA